MLLACGLCGLGLAAGPLRPLPGLPPDRPGLEDRSAPATDASRASASTAALRLELENLLQLRRQLLKRYTRRSPDVRMIDEEIRAVKKRLAALEGAGR